MNASRSSLTTSALIVLPRHKTRAKYMYRPGTSADSVPIYTKTDRPTTRYLVRESLEWHSDLDRLDDTTNLGVELGRLDFFRK